MSINEQYQLLLSKYEKLQKDNQDLQKEIDSLTNAKEILSHIGVLIDATSEESLKKAYDSIKKRQILAQILGM